MVTTRSQDRAESSPIAPLNKRKRFSSEDPEDNIVVEVPVREAKNLEDQPSQEERKAANKTDTEDEDAAPEVLSTKDTAQQARSLPNRSIKLRGTKRRKMANQLHAGGSSPAKEPELDVPAARDSKLETPVITKSEMEVRPNEQLAPDETLSRETPHLLDEESTIPDPVAPQEGASATEIPDSEDEELNTPGSVPAASGQNHSNNLESARSSHLDSSSALALELSSHPINNDSEESTTAAPQTASSEDTFHSAMTELRETPTLQQNQLPLLHVCSDIDATNKQVKPETSQLPVGPPPSFHVEQSEPKQPSPPEQIAVLEGQSTTIPGDQILETSTAATSGIIVPVWRMGTQDESPIEKIRSPSRAVPVGTNRSRQSPKTSVRHQAVFSRTPKPTSIQQYRAQLLNRHPRTANWGPPGSGRRIKFVEA